MAQPKAETGEVRVDDRRRVFHMILSRFSWFQSGHIDGFGGSKDGSGILEWNRPPKSVLRGLFCDFVVG